MIALSYLTLAVPDPCLEIVVFSGVFYKCSRLPTYESGLVQSGSFMRPLTHRLGARNKICFCKFDLQCCGR